MNIRDIIDGTAEVMPKNTEPRVAKQVAAMAADLHGIAVGAVAEGLGCSVDEANELRREAYHGAVVVDRLRWANRALVFGLRISALGRGDVLTDPGPCEEPPFRVIDEEAEARR